MGNHLYFCHSRNVIAPRPSHSPVLLWESTGLSNLPWEFHHHVLTIGHCVCNVCLCFLTQQWRQAPTPSRGNSITDVWRELLLPLKNIHSYLHGFILMNSNSTMNSVKPTLYEVTSPNRQHTILVQFIKTLVVEPTVINFAYKYL